MPVSYACAQFIDVCLILMVVSVYSLGLLVSLSVPGQQKPDLQHSFLLCRPVLWLSGQVSW